MQGFRPRPELCRASRSSELSCKRNAGISLPGATRSRATKRSWPTRRTPLSKLRSASASAVADGEKYQDHRHETTAQQIRAALDVAIGSQPSHPQTTAGMTTTKTKARNTQAMILPTWMRLRSAAKADYRRDSKGCHRPEQRQGCRAGGGVGGRQPRTDGIPTPRIAATIAPPPNKMVR